MDLIFNATSPWNQKDKLEMKLSTAAGDIVAQFNMLNSRSNKCFSGFSEQVNTQENKIIELLRNEAENLTDNSVFPKPILYTF